VSIGNQLQFKLQPLDPAQLAFGPRVFHVMADTQAATLCLSIAQQTLAFLDAATLFGLHRFCRLGYVYSHHLLPSFETL
jgi:hypothetical protein